VLTLVFVANFLIGVGGSPRFGSVCIGLFMGFSLGVPLYMAPLLCSFCLPILVHLAQRLDY